MNRRAQVLFAAAAFPVAAAIGIVAAFTALPPWALGAGFLALTVLLLVWHRLTLRAYRSNGAVIFSRGPWPVLVGLLAIGVFCALDAVVTPTTLAHIWIALGYSISILFYFGFLPSALLFWAADATALTSRILTVKRSLPWSEIDWLYFESSETFHKQLQFVTVARWRNDLLNVEAGPQRRMEVLVRIPLTGGSPSPLLEAIRTRATRAAFGLDQLPLVQARRRPAPVSSSQPEPNLTLPQTVEVARSSAIPATWTRFSVRQGIIWPNIIIYTILSVASIASAVFLVATNTIIGIDLIPSSWTSGSLHTPVLLGEAGLLGIFAIYLFFITLRWLRTLRHPQDYFFLVTPRYVAEVNGKKVTGVALSNVLNLHRSGGGVYGWQLVLDLRSGKQQEFDIGGNYGSPRDLYAYVLAALNARRPAQAVTPFGAAMQSDSEL